MRCTALQYAPHKSVWQTTSYQHLKQTPAPASVPLVVERYNLHCCLLSIWYTTSGTLAGAVGGMLLSREKSIAF